LKAWNQASCRGLSPGKIQAITQCRITTAAVTSHVVFYKFIDKQEIDQSTGEEKSARIPFARVHTVFNIEQCEGIEETEQPQLDQRHQSADEILHNSGADIRHGGDNACYIPSQDMIKLPMPQQFKTPEDYYATALHELTHWTGHKSRCHRDMTGRFGTESYAAEELVAEIGAAFLCAAAGVPGKLQHAEYIQNWLQVLKNDKRAIFPASRLAQEASD